MRTGSNKISDQYFESMAKMQSAIAANDFRTAASLVVVNLSYIRGWVEETSRQYGAFEIPSIPALEQGGRILALVGDESGILKMQEIVESRVELSAWSEYVRRHQKDLSLFEAIQEAVSNRPNCLQSEIKGIVGEGDGRLVATLISYLERADKITRTREGRTYRLISTQSPDAPKPPPKRKVESHRKSHRPPGIREIDFAELTYVPLPRAPSRWEEVRDGREVAKIAEPNGHFEVHDADWRLEEVESIPMADRPDPAFRQVHPSNSGLLMVDDLGKAEGLGRIEAAALRYDRFGNIAAKAGLRHGAYRVGVHPLGNSLIAMSRDCVIHAYDDRLELILETALEGTPEISDLKKRFNIPDERLRNHIRCVALSQDEGRYLFTAVNEAWCVDANGNGLWGARLPNKEGWSRIAYPSSEFRHSEDVLHALDVMGLKLPIVPEDVRRRYRELAKLWHPDTNRGDELAHDKMKALNIAAETLTGIDVTSIPSYTGAYFSRDERVSEIEVGGHTLTMTMKLIAGEIQVADWVYAACFAAESDSVYLAGYSGRVVQVDGWGRGVRAYDIGNVPRRIIDTGDHLYLLTDTRLYILKGDALVSIIDMIEAGDLIVAQTGFGLLEKNRLRWFSEDGEYVGCVLSKDPIRRVYSVGDNMIVETRQRRATVSGVAAFWE